MLEQYSNSYIHVHVVYLELAMAEEIKVPTVDQHGLVDFRRSEVEVFVLEKEEHFVED